MGNCTVLEAEVFGLWVVHDECAGGLFGVDLPVFGEVAADSIGAQQVEEFGLV